MPSKFDLVIVGAGLVGSCLALALRQTPLKIVVLETQLPSFDLATERQSRPLSLTLASQQTFKALNLWEQLMVDAAPIEKVHISEQGQLGELCFSNKEVRAAALGYVVPSAKVARVVYEALRQQSNVTFIPIQSLESIHQQLEQVTVELITPEGPQQLSAELLVGADGSSSRCRKLLGIPSEERDGGDMAVSTNIHLIQPHNGVAYERFTSGGVIALLPSYSLHQYQVVWVASKEQIADMQGWSEMEIIGELTMSLGKRLFISKAEPFSAAHPLTTVNVKNPIAGRAVLLGNAAHTFYPLAAQGFNLGLKDAATLAEQIEHSSQKHSGASLGEIDTLLKKYKQLRSRDQRFTQCLTEGVSQGFNIHPAIIGKIRGLSLMAVQLCLPLKRSLTRQLMGL